jgi:cysteine-rich repeat protein
MKFKIGVLVLLLILSMGFYSGYAIFGITPLQSNTGPSSIEVGPAIIIYEQNTTGETNQTCGNNLTEPGEECDDGSLINGDGCDQFCKIENGTNSTYQCSDHLDNDIDLLIDFPNDPGCSSPTDNDEWNGPICGNNLTEPGEECDDGNLINGDGCDQFCRIENTTNKSIGGNPRSASPSLKIKETVEITGMTLEEEDEQVKLSISSKGGEETTVGLSFFEEDFIGRKIVEELELKSFIGGGVNEYYLTLRGLSAAKGFFDGDHAKMRIEATIGSKTYKSDIHKIAW